MAKLLELSLGVNAYRDLHVEAGSFVTACLENNLYNALMFADGESFDHIRELMQYIHAQIPINAWGSRENVRAWIKAG